MRIFGSATNSADLKLMDFSINNIDESLEELSQRIGGVILAESHGQTLQFSSNLCDVWMQSFYLRPGFRFVIEKLMFQESLVQKLEYQSDLSTICFSFCLEGETWLTINDAKQKFRFAHGQSCIGVSMGSAGTIQYSAGQQSRFVTLYLDLQIFHRLIGEQLTQLPNPLQQALQDKQQPLYFQTCSVNTALQVAAAQVWNCSYQGLTRQLYLESKAIELIALSLQEYTTESLQYGNSIILKADDIDRIHQAKEILTQQLDNPPSLLQLSRQVGLNDYKLKQGFRQVFGTTVFGYLRNYRMQQAEQLVVEDEMTISEVAYAVGFTNRGRFAATFKQMFGLSPHLYQAEKRRHRLYHF